MATKKAGSVGRIGRIGKIESDKSDGKQRKLTAENSFGNKKVTFREESEDKINNEVMEKVKILLQEELREFKELKEKWRNNIKKVERKERIWEERIKGLEEKIGILEKESIESIKEGQYTEEDMSNSVESIRGSRKGRSNSRQSSWRGSKYSDDILSEQEVGKLRRLVREKERENRRNNIVIKGMDIEKTVKDREGWVQELLNDRLKVGCKIVNVKKSGPVLIVKVDNEESKKKVMKNKYKLKEGNIFIENDLTWEERKIQEKIGRWVKEQKSKGLKVKASYARVKINEVWKRWEEIEREWLSEGVRDGEGRESDSSGKLGNRKKNRNFI